MIKAIFFDSGDVVVKEGFTPGIIEFETAHGLPKGSVYAVAHDQPYWREFTLGHITEEEYFNSIKEKLSKKLNINELKKSIDNNFSSNDELLTFLKTLKGKYILGIISNHPKEWFSRCVVRFGWSEIFSVYAVSGELHVRKPDKQIFEKALNKAKILGQECVYVDNRGDRVEGAESVGMRVIIYKNVNQLKDDLSIILNH